MNLISFILLFVLFVAVPKTSAKIFTECSLAKELFRLGTPKSELPDWVCIAKYESSFNTKAVGKLNTDGTRDWGLFQLNDRWWCQSRNGRKSHNVCKISCDDLLVDDITRAVKCARTVKKQQGYKAWVAWNNKCQGAKPNTNKCF